MKGGVQFALHLMKGGVILYTTQQQTAVKGDVILDCNEGRCVIGMTACMNVAMLCCHVRRQMRVYHVMLQKALHWLHESCMGLVFGESRSTNPCVFPAEWLQPAMTGNIAQNGPR